MPSLSGNTALITGAAMGMGASHARRFVEEGARVVITDMNVDAGKALAYELGDGALCLEHNVADPTNWERVVADGTRHFGPITVLVNNAGIAGVASAYRRDRH